jgi:hypothetical protein
MQVGAISEKSVYLMFLAKYVSVVSSEKGGTHKRDYFAERCETVNICTIRST